MFPSLKKRRNTTCGQAARKPACNNEITPKVTTSAGTGDAVGVLSDKDYTQFPRARFAWNIDKRGMCLS